MKVAVLSASYGGYDRVTVAPPQQTVDADWIMVSDTPDVAKPPWRVIVEPRQFVEPRLASRVPKTNPEFYTDADIVIWKDANIDILSGNFVEWAIESLGDSSLCQFQQVARESIFAEIRASRGIPKWNNEPFDAQVEYYLSKGYPPDYGIWWCGLMIRSKDCPNFGHEWMTEMVRWTCQDQMAYSYLMWVYGIRPKEPTPNAEGTHYRISSHKGKLVATDESMGELWSTYMNNLKEPK